MNKKKKIALVTMAKDEDFYIQEWIDYHLKLGFDNIFIYKNNWEFKNIIPNDRVHFLEWNKDSTLQTENQKTWEWNRHAQCYSSFGKDYYNDYDWAAFFDVDCFLVLKKKNDVKEFISEFDNIKQPQVIINMRFFGDNGITSFDENHTSVLERFTKRWDEPHNHSYYGFLPICKLHENFCCHEIHRVEGNWFDVNTGKVGNSESGENREINYNKAQLNHYYVKTLPEWKEKMTKTRAEGDWFSNSLSGFILNNFNDIEDLHALNFLKNKK